VKSKIVDITLVNVTCCKHKKQLIESSDLGMLVEAYLRCYKDSYKIEDLWWAESSTWEKALERAWNSRFCNGKMYSHQCHVAHKLPEGLKISLDAKVQPSRFKDFHKLYSWIKSINICIKGLGDTTTYDVARRLLGVWMRMQPEFVYLHAGSAKGAKKLGIEGEAVLLSAFPHQIQKLSVTHTENFLCLYKKEIAAITVQNAIYSNNLSSSE